MATYTTYHESPNNLVVIIPSQPPKEQVLRAPLARLQIPEQSPTVIVPLCCPPGLVQMLIQRLRTVHSQLSQEFVEEGLGGAQYPAQCNQVPGVSSGATASGHRAPSTTAITIPIIQKRTGKIGQVPRR